MAGLIEQEKVSDPILAQIKAGVEAEVPKELKRDYAAIIVAGLKLMYSDHTHRFMREYLAGVKQRGNNPKMVAHGIVKLMSIIQNESKRTDMMPAIFPAALVLMTYALEDIEKDQGVQFTKDQVAAIAQMVTFQLLKLFHINPDMIHQAVQKGRPAPGQSVPGTPATGAPALTGTPPVATGRV